MICVAETLASTLEWLKMAAATTNRSGFIALDRRPVGANGTWTIVGKNVKPIIHRLCLVAAVKFLEAQ
jgi:hypothetical protein